MSELTREELLAFTQAHKDQAIALNNVCELVGANSEKLDKVLDKLNNGLKSDITNEIIGKGDERTSLNAIKKDTSNTASDIKMSKYFLGATILLSIIVSVLANALLRAADLTRMLNQITTAVKSGG